MSMQKSYLLWYVCTQKLFLVFTFSIAHNMAVDGHILGTDIWRSHVLMTSETFTKKC